MSRAVEAAKEQGTQVVVGNILSSDIFYNQCEAANDLWRSMGVLTISDHIYTGEALSAEDRQIGFGKMMEIALELA